MTPAAWLHELSPEAFVITDEVKKLWLKIRPRHVEHYTIPLYVKKEKRK